MRTRSSPSGAREREDVSEARLLLRLVLGAASVGGDELDRAMRDWVREAKGRAPPETGGDAHPMRHRLIGALIMTPAYAEDATAKVRSMYRRTFAGLVATITDLVRRTRRGERLHARAEALRGRLEREVDRWEVIGRFEEREGRAMARVGRDAVLDGVFQRLAEDPELRELIAEQSAGLSKDLLDEARDLTESADGRLESALRRVFGRAPRPVGAGRGNGR